MAKEKSMKPISTPKDVPKSEQIREPKKSFPTIEMETKSPAFNSENKQSQVQATDDKGTDENEAPDVGQTKAP
jgi:hypothetical protein